MADDEHPVARIAEVEKQPAGQDLLQLHDAGEACPLVLGEELEERHFPEEFRIADHWLRDYAESPASKES